MPLPVGIGKSKSWMYNLVSAESAENGHRGRRRGLSRLGEVLASPELPVVLSESSADDGCAPDWLGIGAHSVAQSSLTP